MLAHLAVGILADVAASVAAAAAAALFACQKSAPHTRGASAHARIFVNTRYKCTHSLTTTRALQFVYSIWRRWLHEKTMRRTNRIVSLLRNTRIQYAYIGCAVVCCRRDDDTSSALMHPHTRAHTRECAAPLVCVWCAQCQHEISIRNGGRVCAMWAACRRDTTDNILIEYVRALSVIRKSSALSIASHHNHHRVRSCSSIAV